MSPTFYGMDAGVFGIRVQERIMGPHNLVVVCASAFAAVFLLLAFLSLVMRIIITVFPQRLSQDDAAVIAAVSATVSAVYPGTKITRFEEIK